MFLSNLRCSGQKESENFQLRSIHKFMDIWSELIQVVE